MASATVSAGGYAANGNLFAHSDSVMGDWGFGYDTLNRLTGAAAADNAPANYVHTLGCWAYDSFGNRTLNAYVAATDCKSTTTATASYTASNKVSFVSQAAPISYSAPSGFTYDAGGNVHIDGRVPQVWIFRPGFRRPRCTFVSPADAQRKGAEMLFRQRAAPSI